MAMKDVDTNLVFVKWTEVDENTVVKGFYIDTHESDKYKDTYYHVLEMSDGENKGKRYAFNGNANLDRALVNVRKGWYVEIEYKGTEEMPSNSKYPGAKCHQFKLRYDDERIHPLFSGDASSNAPAQYENSGADKKQAEPEKQPEKSEQKQEAPAGEAPKKRNAF